MPKLKRLTRRRQRVPIGDLDTLIFVEDRVQVEPDFNAVDADMKFDAHPDATQIWARIETTAGKTHFDGVETDRRITDRVAFRALSGITAQTWLRLADGTRLDIVELTNLDRRGEFMEALCEATGSDAKKAADL